MIRYNCWLFDYNASDLVYFQLCLFYIAYSRLRRDHLVWTQGYVWFELLYNCLSLSLYLSLSLSLSLSSGKRSWYIYQRESDSEREKKKEKERGMSSSVVRFTCPNPPNHYYMYQSTNQVSRRPTTCGVHPISIQFLPSFAFASQHTHGTKVRKV